MAKMLVAVKMLVDTAYQGPKHAGEIVHVPEDFANRWVKNKIAERVIEEHEEVIEEEVVETDAEEVTEVEEETIDYSKMNAKELFALCKEKGIEVEAKKSKEYYIEKLA